MKKYIFVSDTNTSGNTYAVFGEMIKSRIEGKYIWLCNNEKEIETHKQLLMKPNLENNIKIIFVQKKSIKGLLFSFIGNYIFYTHGFFEKFSSPIWQKKINLWHGMPLKMIGKLSNKAAKFNFDYTISNSPIFNEPLIRSFGINPDKILHMGSPRNDFFSSNDQFDFFDLFDNLNQTVIWMPTYRKNIYSEDLNGEYDENAISFFSLLDMQNLDVFLKKKGINLIVKLHPYDLLNKNYKMEQVNKECTNIRIATSSNNLLPQNFYSILNKTSALITDYSSIYFDYLLLNKPIAIDVSDRTKYVKNRGLIENVDKSIKNYTIHDIQSFFLFLSSLVDDDKVTSLKSMTEDQKNVFQKYDNFPNNSKDLLTQLGFFQRGSKK
ncbi:CDP-glycerol glycerophosphotransferase family protein [Enterococcus sp. SMC-9]|uniref:CDP-glycerol glycerophosphotransferase family protein n=1 Tax=Enterococcus sp. SMC-9 TaxID=2862343 RepID=UPI001E5184DC|nr:CDP-glycerol glycerophosphotransferase family protein [Enterococcus sp. SMC-9]MCD1024640.1 CDP-glycerol glycerophosphotransferase family protein [Enterococcus sp. SMC-9]